MYALAHVVCYRALQYDLAKAALAYAESQNLKPRSTYEPGLLALAKQEEDKALENWWQVYSLHCEEAEDRT